MPSNTPHSSALDKPEPADSDGNVTLDTDDTTPPSLKGIDPKVGSMAATNASQPSLQTERLDLRALGSTVLPPEASTIEVTTAGDLPQGGGIAIVFKRRWELSVAAGSAEVESVTDADDGLLEKPERVPAWLERVCARYDIDEVTL